MRGITAGMLLVASPLLADPHFLRSIVFILDHDAHGTLGLILNRPLPMPLGDVWDDCPTSLSQVELCAEGGPVERGRGLLLHGFPDINGAHSFGPGLAIGGETSDLLARCPQGPGPQGPRLFLGHAGWSPQQLDEELAAGSWLMRSGNPQLLLAPDPPEDLWQELVAASGDLPDPSAN